MLRPVLFASTTVALLASLTACGDDKADTPADAGSKPSSSVSGTPTETPSASEAPPATWKQSPGQADRVKAALAGFTCSDLSDQYYTFTACSKPDRRSVSYLKFVAAKDGTVVFAKVSRFKDVKPAVTAIVGATDTAVLLASGTTLKWGYGGKDWVSINGMNSAPEPPQAKPFENTRADLVSLLNNGDKLTCKVEDAEQTTAPPADPNEITPSVSPTPAPSSVRCAQENLMASERSSLSATFAGDSLTAIRVTGDYDFKGEAARFAPMLASVKQILDKVWPALKGGDPQAVRAFVEAHLKVGGGVVGYVDGRAIAIYTWAPPGADTAGLQISIASEKVGLEVPVN